MKKSIIACMAVAVLGSPMSDAQTFFSLHAGSDGVGVDVSNVSTYYPVMVAPPPRPHVHVPLMPGYVPTMGEQVQQENTIGKLSRNTARQPGITERR